MLLTAKLVIF